MRLQLDLLDEVRATIEQRLARYQNLMAKHYNSRVRHRDFQVEDLILRKVMGASRDPTQGKLGPNWEGPYRITSWQRKGTYDLETLDGAKATPSMEYRAPKKVLPVESNIQQILSFFTFCQFNLIIATFSGFLVYYLNGLFSLFKFLSSSFKELLLV